MVPADCRLIQSASLRCDEAALTGESVPVEKDAAADVDDLATLGDRVNMAYAGCAVSYGRAKAVVVETGMTTEMGKIAAMLDNETEGATPLQQRLAQLGKALGLLAFGICAVILVVGLINGMNPLDIFMTAISLAVAAVPEGLPAIVTIVLALGVQRLVAKNAIIRRLPAVETLGCASVICSDKTGTLTQNRMTHARHNGKSIILSRKYLKAGLPLSVLRPCVPTERCVSRTAPKAIGDPTETAIVAAIEIRSC